MVLEVLMSAVSVCAETSSEAVACIADAAATWDVLGDRSGTALPENAQGLTPWFDLDGDVVPAIEVWLNIGACNETDGERRDDDVFVGESEELPCRPRCPLPGACNNSGGGDSADEVNVDLGVGSLPVDCDRERPVVGKVLLLPTNGTSTEPPTERDLECILTVVSDPGGTVLGTAAGAMALDPGVTTYVVEVGTARPTPAEEDCVGYEGEANC